MDLPPRSARRLRASLFVALSAFLAALALLPAAASAQRAPVIQRVEPTSGPVGSVVTIVGRFFADGQQVRIGETVLEVRSRTAFRVSLLIPEGTSSGDVQIVLPGGEIVRGPRFRITEATSDLFIDSVEPATASAGHEVTLHGGGFAARLTDNTVTMGSLPVIVRAATRETLTIQVPEGAQTGPIRVRTRNAATAALSPDLTIVAGLAITALAPPAAPPGSRVTLSGTGFAARAQDNHVRLGDTELRVRRASETSLEVEIPRRHATGAFPVTVVVDGHSADSAAPLRVAFPPRIASVSPTRLSPGHTLEIRGEHFGADIRNLLVAVGGSQLRVRELADNRIVAEVPEGASSGQLVIDIPDLEPATYRDEITVLAAVTVASFTPTSGGAGSTVVVRGGGFSATASENNVTIGGARCEVVEAAADSLRIRIPTDARSAPIRVTVPEAGEASTSSHFNVTRAPVVDSFEPRAAQAGAVITVRGHGFGTNPSLLAVTVGGRRTEIRSATDTELRLVLPADARTGPVRVTLRLYGTGESADPLTLLGPFAVSAIEPAATFPGGLIHIRGEGFTREGTQVRFPRARRDAEIQFVSERELRAIVPPRTPSGAVTVTAPDGRSATQPLVVERRAPAGVAILEVIPACTWGGCHVTLYGHGFNRRTERNTVRLDDTELTVVAGSETHLEVVLPETPGTHRFRVTVEGSEPVESGPFRVGH